MASRTYGPWPAPVVTAVAGVLGDTVHGLTGREIGQLLAAVRVPDAEGGNKRDRLAGALLAQQARQQVSNCVIAFITAAMAPVRYAQQPQAFSRRQDDLNEVLVHVGLRVNDEGKLATGPAAATLDEAARHAGSLRAELRRRATHPEVLRYCTLEILAKNAFHAGLEAVKSVADRLRTLTGEHLDGARLVDAVLMPGRGTARVAVNANVTGPELDEQKGLAALVKGLFSMYRNPAAHEPRLHRTVTDEELLELLTTLSMVHRRLDGAHVTP
ncbi:TIGR02391 family protein [Streptomyces sp. NBC_01622]|uniref:TIGR02391 family protein n=1 Tax=Streptomyces sp. NBC_01622 TaxID=2975903 RepID=UPI00386627C3|nr:TIGR02391 family protein [Streptomyces sp. NBC_01622]WTE48680.1 TIGR02391 family protein [Streptomyces sp. NBC_01622]